MKTYLLLFLVSAVFSLTLTPLLRRMCEKWGWLDEPRDNRRLHINPIPRLGGVAVGASMLLAFLVLLVLPGSVSGHWFDNLRSVWAILLPAYLILVFGLVDDLRDLRPRYKFLAQGLAAALFYFLGGKVTVLTLPFMGSVNLPEIVGFGLTLLWIVAITNAFNLIDGMDGLATGVALFAGLIMLMVALPNEQIVITVILLSLVGALVGFLRYNFNPASIFLGDCGSLFIGFLMAALSVKGTQKASTAIAVTIPILAFALPILDTVMAIGRRFVGGKPLFKGDREHIHHMLLARGWSQRRAALTLYALCGIFGFTALLILSDYGNRFFITILVVLSVVVVVFLGQLRYHEVDEVRAGVWRNVVERRLRIANNVRMRRTSHSISQAATLYAILCHINELLEVGSFAHAELEMSPVAIDPAYRCELLLALAKAGASDEQRQLLDKVELHANNLFWEWENPREEWTRRHDPTRFWSLQLPLTTESGYNWGHINLYRRCGREGIKFDFSYLTTLFQRDISYAAERLFLSTLPTDFAKPSSVSSVSN